MGGSSTRHRCQVEASSRGPSPSRVAGFGAGPSIATLRQSMKVAERWKKPAAFDLSPLGHPAWWGALVLLLVNDGLLKGGGVVPGWLTGKLSDFAFLIVAPVLFAALIPRALPRRRTIALVAVVGLYVAADLSRGVSDAVVAAAARFGLTWKLWPDPTDLIALAVLPLTIRLMRAPPSARVLAPYLRERAGVLLGAAACLATSSNDYASLPFLLNAAAGDVTVRVTWGCRASTAFAIVRRRSPRRSTRAIWTTRGSWSWRADRSPPWTDLSIPTSRRLASAPRPELRADASARSSRRPRRPRCSCWFSPSGRRRHRLPASRRWTRPVTPDRTR